MERARRLYGNAATVMNALAMQVPLNRMVFKVVFISSTNICICEPYIRRRAVRHMEKKRIVIFAAGAGNPFFTTDTARLFEQLNEVVCNT